MCAPRRTCCLERLVPSVHVSRGEGVGFRCSGHSGFRVGAGGTYLRSTLVLEVSNGLPEPVLGLLWQAMPWMVELHFSTLSVRQLHGNGTDTVLTNLWQASATSRSGVLTAATSTAGGAAGVGAQGEGGGLRHALAQPSRRSGVTGRTSPAALEAILRLPPSAIVQVTIDFDRSFVSYSDYPADSARGFDAGAAAFSYWTTAALTMGGVATRPQAAISGDPDALRELQPSGTVYTEAGLVITSSWPDFSMPYNIICVTCTFPMLVFGVIVTGSLQSNPASAKSEPPRPLVSFILWWLRLFDTLFD
jgi:hypothetical protein